MEVYIINIVLILFWRLVFTQKRFPNSREIYCGIVAFQWILISGLRDWNVGADTYNYYNIFEQAKGISWGTALRNFVGYSFRDVLSRDQGYTVVTKIFQLFSGSYQIFLIAIAMLFMGLMAIWIYKNSASPCTSYILFSTLFYAFETLTRQNIAIALVVFLGYDLIKKQKFWKFAAISFAAALIHKSSLVFFPMYFISRIPVTVGYMSLCAVIVAAIAILGESFYGLIAEWLGYESFLDYTEGGAELYAALLVILCIIIWGLYPLIKRHHKDAQILFHINIMTLITGLLVIQNQSFMRIQLYYSLFLMITIPELINTVKREYRLLGYLLFGTVMILYLVYNNPQYKFFFMS